VNLYFTRARDVIAVEPVSSARLPESLPALETNSGYRMNAARFCTHFGITLDSTQKSLAPDIHDGKLWLKLGETIATTRVVKQKRKD
jgi:hypothetical protein